MSNNASLFSKGNAPDWSLNSRGSEPKSKADAAFADLLVGSEGSHLLAAKTSNLTLKHLVQKEEVKPPENPGLKSLDFDFLARPTIPHPAPIHDAGFTGLVPRDGLPGAKIHTDGSNAAALSGADDPFGFGVLDPLAVKPPKSNATASSLDSNALSDFLLNRLPAEKPLEKGAADELDIFNVSYLEKRSVKPSLSTELGEPSISGFGTGAAPVASTSQKSRDSNPEAQGGKFDTGTAEPENSVNKADVTVGTTLKQERLSSRAEVASSIGDGKADRQDGYDSHSAHGPVASHDDYGPADEAQEDIGSSLAKTASSWMSFAKSRVEKAIATASKSDIVRKTNSVLSNVQTHVKQAASSNSARSSRLNDFVPSQPLPFVSRGDSLKAFDMTTEREKNAFFVAKDEQPVPSNASITTIDQPAVNRQVLSSSAALVPATAKPIVHATKEESEASNAAKLLGTEAFKKGQFDRAVEHYTAAIAALPKGHLELVSLLNNRAAATLKTGHYQQTIEDCEAVLLLEAADLRALIKRAFAYEQLEKWELAMADYKLLLLKGHQNGTVNQGLGRCLQALKSNSAEPNLKPPNAGSVSKEMTTDEIDKSAAVQRIREQEAVREREQGLALELKDQIDVKLKNWVSGKETNLRALIATLDSVLWKNSGWQTVGMSELVEPSRCKVKYLKAISKVHPDKLAKDEPLEHRLLASGIFTTLNKAWDEFKASNNLS